MAFAMDTVRSSSQRNLPWPRGAAARGSGTESHGHGQALWRWNTPYMACKYVGVQVCSLYVVVCSRMAVVATAAAWSENAWPGRVVAYLGEAHRGCGSRRQFGHGHDLVVRAVAKQAVRPLTWRCGCAGGPPSSNLLPISCSRYRRAGPESDTLEASACYRSWQHEAPRERL